MGIVELLNSDVAQMPLLLELTIQDPTVHLSLVNIPDGDVVPTEN